MNSRPAVVVFGSSLTTEGSEEWKQGEEAGRRLAESGFDVVTGGYGGTMEAVSKGAAAVGAQVVGVVAPALFPARSGPNPYVTEVIEAASLTDRIGTMIGRSRGAMVLPGSTGTAAEFLLAWNLNHIVRRNGGTPFPTVAVGDAWRAVARLLTEEIDSFPGDVHLASNSGEAVDWLVSRAKNL